MIPYFIPDMPTTDQLIPYLKEIDHNRWYSNFGPLYKTFTQRLSDTLFPDIDTDRISLVASGTAAIELALKSLHLPQGSAVLTSCFTFPATIEAIYNVGLTPILCDIDKYSWQLSPSIAEGEISQHNIAAVLPVACFGMPVCSDSWGAFQQKTNIPVIVDAAAALTNQIIHSNLMYAFSLHATKTVGIGEGGIVISPHSTQATLIKKLSNFGIEEDRTISTSGNNAKLSEYHCAVGLAQLDRLNDILTAKQRIFDLYISAFDQAKLPISYQAGITHDMPANLYITFARHTAKQVSDHLSAHNIETRQLYSPLIHQHKGFSNIKRTKGGAQKHAITLSEKGLALPFHAHLTHQEIKTIVNELVNVLLP